MRLMRACEDVVPPGLLRLLLIPTVMPSALAGFRLRSKLEAGWKALGISSPKGLKWLKESIRFHRVRYLNFWPDRLTLSRWQHRMTFKGIEPVRALQSEKQPVVLVCLHHGPIHILRYLLRAAGVACAMVVLESRAERSPVREWKDRLSPPPEVPNVFCRDELKEMKLFMEQGGCLLVAADYGRDKMCEVPFGPAQIRVASGAFRLAESVGATVFPVSVVETSGWQFELEIYDGIARNGSIEQLAAKVLAQLAPKVLATPALMHSQLADSLVPGAKTGDEQSEF